MLKRSRIDRSLHRSRVLACVAAATLAGAAPGYAQFLRIGPFDFSGEAYVQGVYTTNVEQERESVSQAEREDYYYVVGLDLRSKGQITPTTVVDIETGIAVERHFNRPDLNNSENPFGNVRIASLSEFGRYYVRGLVEWRHESASADDTFVPGGKKKRDPRTTLFYEVATGRRGDHTRFEAGYNFSRERHEDEQFKSGDQDERNWFVLASQEMTRRITLRQEYTDKETTQVGLPDEPVTAEKRFFAGWDLRLFFKPQFTYTGGIEWEETTQDGADWDWIHGVALQDEREIYPGITLIYGGAYEYEQDKEQDDLTPRYYVGLNHEISRSTSQSFLYTREPRDQFGSTADTDTTTYNYTFNKLDLFIRDLDLTASVDYEINEPETGLQEKIWRYEATLRHTSRLTRKIERGLEYLYFLEENDQYSGDPIEEHRVTLDFTYEL